MLAYNIVFVICRDPSKPAIDEAGFLSLMFLTWASPVISRGFKRPLQLDDFDKISPYESAEVNFKRVTRLWNDEVKQKGLENASMHRVIWRAVRTRLSFGIFFLLISQLVSFLVPVSKIILIVNIACRNLATLWGQRKYPYTYTKEGDWKFLGGRVCEKLYNN